MSVALALQSGAAACATGSSCEDNPFVDVTPDGSFLECEGQVTPLTAVTSGVVAAHPASAAADHAASTHHGAKSKSRGG